jgi:hypothetical protein
MVDYSPLDFKDPCDEPRPPDEAFVVLGFIIGLVVGLFPWLIWFHWGKRRKQAMKKILLVAGLLGGSSAFGGGLPPVPPSPTYSEPSQIIGTLNALINQLNGNALGSGGYAAQPGGAPSLGTFCQPAAGGTPQTCNANRGSVAFTGITITTTGTSQSLVINNSTVTAQSDCSAQWGTAFTAGSGVIAATVTPGAGTLTVVNVNAGTTANAVTTGTLNFVCTNWWRRARKRLIIRLEWGSGGVVTAAFSNLR